MWVLKKKQQRINTALEAQVSKQPLLKQSAKLKQLFLFFFGVEANYCCLMVFSR